MLSSSRQHKRAPVTQAGPLPMLQLTPIVFVVDDDVSVRESLELMIRAEQWRVETFSSAEEFLVRPRSTSPCCLVLDLSLPNVNGLDLQKRLADRREMPIIFISGYGDIPASVRAMSDESGNAAMRIALDFAGTGDNVLGVPDIEPAGANAGPIMAQSQKRRLIDVSRPHPGSLIGERDGGGASNALPRCRHQCNFSR